jgi:hypothetical protein
MLIVIGLGTAEFVYYQLAGVQMFTQAVQGLGALLPWIEGGCSLAITAIAITLASTWGSPEWWVERWARSHDNYAV